VAEEMGVTLRRTSFSPNIKERRDYSCAVFDASGRVIAQGDHMPVHLGSMPMAVAAALREVEIEPGDVVALNDPFAGGTHLPDVTLISSVVSGQSSASGKRRQRPKSKDLSSTLPTALITPTLVERHRAQWVWPSMSTAKACAFRPFALCVAVKFAAT